MMRCPCCQREWIGPATEAAINWRLSKMERRTYDVIRARPGISGDELADALYAHRVDGGPLGGRDVARQYVARINAKLAPHGLAIRGKYNGMQGYRLISDERIGVAE